MKFSLAIVALLGATSAIKIREDPAAAPVDADAAAAKAAGAPPANVADPANPGKAVVAEALKSEEAKSDEAAAAAGGKIDTSDAPVAVAAPAGATAADPVELSDAEKMRNHILRIAAVGQEAIKVSDVGVAATAAKYAPPAKVEAAAPGDAKAAEKTPEEREADGKALGDAAKATQK
jgi:ribonuclease E